MKTRGKVLKTTYPIPADDKLPLKPKDEFEAEFFSSPNVSDHGSEDSHSDYNESSGKRKRRMSKHKALKKGKTHKPLREEPRVTRSMVPAISKDVETVVDRDDAVKKSTRSTESTISTLTHSDSASVVGSGSGSDSDSLPSSPNSDHFVRVNTSRSPARFDRNSIILGSNPGPPRVIRLSIGDMISQARENGLDPTAQFTARVLGNGTIMIEDAINEDGRPTRVPVPKLQELPTEVALKIYRQLFVSRDFINFASRSDLDRSAALLRTCKKIHQLGTAVLYGENAFHFERRCEVRGAYYDKTWEEIGYSDMWRFFDSIGPQNISHIKYLSFQLSDAVPSQTQYMQEIDRRAANNGHLLDVFKMVAAGGVLETLAISFTSRRNIDRIDYWFLKYLTAIRCHEFFTYNMYSLYHGSKLAANVESKMRNVMVVKRDIAAKKGEKKIKPKMIQDSAPKKEGGDK